MKIAPAIRLLTAVCLWTAPLCSTEPARALGPVGPAAEALRESLTFYASFDDSVDADVAKGDARLFTSPNGKREDAKPGLQRDDVALVKTGRHGGGLLFAKKSSAVVYFEAAKNVAYSQGAMRGTVSFWLSLDPAKDLEPGFCDPIQITDKTWNDAAIWVDFSKENPREFRLGAFADKKVWNPTDRKFDDIPENERPMVPVRKPPFAKGRWTHVVFTYDGFNARNGDGTAKLYLDGKLQGELVRRQVFTWDPSKTRILLGLSYIGLFDELSIFDRALTADEVNSLYRLDGGLQSLASRSKSKSKSKP